LEIPVNVPRAKEFQPHFIDNQEPNSTARLNPAIPPGSDFANPSPGNFIAHRRLMLSPKHTHKRSLN
jgi:hypothetical protein